MAEIITLDNGLKLVGEKIDHSRSVSVGFWVATGSCNEQKPINGISHFIEHMLFKGTEKRSARDLSVQMDAVGGQLNAFTSKECTCYYAQVTDEHVDLALDILTDMLLNSKLDPEEIEKEKGVVLEEIHMVEDTPEDLVHELLATAYYADHALGMTVLGTEDTLMSLTQQKMKDYMHTQYRPNNVVLSVAGKFEAKMITDWIHTHVSGWELGSPQGCDQGFSPKPNYIEKRKNIEQTHLCLGFPGLAREDEDAYASFILNNLLGGGMSSRLFQKIREDLGVAYSVYSYPTSYAGSGMMALYAGLKPSQSRNVANLIFDEVDDLLAKGPTEEEFIRAKEQLKGNTVLGRETTSSRMSANGKSLLLRGRVVDEDEIMNRIQAVTIDDVRRVIGRVFQYDKMCASLVGKADKTNNLEKIVQDANKHAGKKA